RDHFGAHPREVSEHRVHGLFISRDDARRKNDNITCLYLELRMRSLRKPTKGRVLLSLASSGNDEHSFTLHVAESIRRDQKVTPKSKDAETRSNLKLPIQAVTEKA